MQFQGKSSTAFLPIRESHLLSSYLILMFPKIEVLKFYADLRQDPFSSLFVEMNIAGSHQLVFLLQHSCKIRCRYSGSADHFMTKRGVDVSPNMRSCTCGFFILLHVCVCFCVCVSYQQLPDAISRAQEKTKCRRTEAARNRLSTHDPYTT